MPKYKVNVEVQYDESVVVEAENEHEAIWKAETLVASRVSYYGSMNVQASGEPEETDEETD